MMFDSLFFLSLLYQLISVRLKGRVDGKHEGRGERKMKEGGRKGGKRERRENGIKRERGGREKGGK
jgi:hypothetical protein